MPLITRLKLLLNRRVRPKPITIRFIHKADCRVPKMWIFCFSQWTMQSSSFRLFNLCLPKKTHPPMSLHLILSRSCSDYYGIAGLWFRTTWYLTSKIHFNNAKVLTATLVKLSPDRYTEKPIRKPSNTQNGNCLFPLFSGLIALLWPEMTDFHSSHTCLRPQYSLLWPEMTDFHSSHTCLRPQYSRRNFVGKLKPGWTTAFFPIHEHCPHRIKFSHKETIFENTTHLPLPMTA